MSFCPNVPCSMESARKFPQTPSSLVGELRKISQFTHRATERIKGFRFLLGGLRLWLLPSDIGPWRSARKGEKPCRATWRSHFGAIQTTSNNIKRVSNEICTTCANEDATYGCEEDRRKKRSNETRLVQDPLRKSVWNPVFLADLPVTMCFIESLPTPTPVPILTLLVSSLFLSWLGFAFSERTYVRWMLVLKHTFVLRYRGLALSQLRNGFYTGWPAWSTEADLLFFDSRCNSLQIDKYDQICNIKK